MERESNVLGHSAIGLPSSDSARAENQLLAGDQIRMLKLIGRGTPREEIASEFSLTTGKLKNELAAVYKKLGVRGPTAAVQQAITLCILNTEELVDRDFDWRVFNDLTDTERAIMETFIYAKDENLTDEEFNALDIKTSRDPNKYITESVNKIRNKLGLEGKTTTVVYYRAFKEKEQNTGEESRAVDLALTEREVGFLQLARQKVPGTAIGRRLSLYIDTAAYRKNILNKLGVSSLEEALAKAEEIGLLSKNERR